MTPRVSQKTVAAAAKVHPTTVSMALRNHPALPEPTRKRIQELAAKMGYRPDPALDVLNAYRLGEQRRTFQGMIAWLDCWTQQREIFQPGHPLGAHWQGTKARCEERGYRLESFLLGSNGLSSNRLSQILRERGIQGLIIPQIPGGRGHLRLHWDWFSVVALTFSLARPSFHAFVPDHFLNMRLLMRHLRHGGSKRPGLIILRHENLRTDTLRAASYLVLQQTTLKSADVVPILSCEELTEKELLQWYMKYTPDSIITHDSPVVIAWLQKSGISVPGDVVVADINMPSEINTPGLIENVPDQTRMAVDYLIAMLHRGERGIPLNPARIMIAGTWHDPSGICKSTKAKSKYNRDC